MSGKFQPYRERYMMDRHDSKQRVDMLVKELRKVQAYCAEHPRGCRGCALLNLWGGCKLRSRPAVWDLDGAGYFDESTSTSEKRRSRIEKATRWWGRND